MGRRAKLFCSLPDGRQVGYAPKVRFGFFKVQFKHPTEPKHVELATGVPIPPKWSTRMSPPPTWFHEAQRIIRETYCPSPAGPDSAAPDAPLSWDEVVPLVRDDIDRPASLRTYMSAISLVRKGLAAAGGPAEVTAESANAFLKRYARSKFVRAKGEGAVERPRSAQTVKTTLNNLKVLWARLIKMGVVAENVWAAVDTPKVPKKNPRVPSEAVFKHFFEWLTARYPGPDGGGWPLLRLFLVVKLLTGCRLNDLCQLESSQLDTVAGTLTISPQQDKTHRERVIHLPPGIVTALDRAKGPRLLWERYVEDSATYRPGKGRSKVFAPSVLYHAVESTFREHNMAHPDKRVTSHDFRRRALTMVTLALGGDLEAATQVIPVSIDTARGYYIDAKKAYDVERIQKETAAPLLGFLAGEYGVE